MLVMPRLLTSHLALVLVVLVQISTQVAKSLICGGHDLFGLCYEKWLGYVIYFVATHVSYVHGLLLVSASQRFQEARPHKPLYWVQSKHQPQS